MHTLTLSKFFQIPAKGQWDLFSYKYTGNRKNLIYKTDERLLYLYISCTEFHGKKA